MKITIYTNEKSPDGNIYSLEVEKPESIDESLITLSILCGKDLISYIDVDQDKLIKAISCIAE